MKRMISFLLALGMLFTTALPAFAEGAPEAETVTTAVTASAAEAVAPEAPAEEAEAPVEEAVAPEAPAEEAEAPVEEAVAPEAPVEEAEVLAAETVAIPAEEVSNFDQWHRYLLDKNPMKLSAEASSQNSNDANVNDGPAGNAFDGRHDKFWHSAYSNHPNPHSIKWNLTGNAGAPAGTVTVIGMDYYGRGVTNGTWCNGRRETHNAVVDATDKPIKIYATASELGKDETESSKWVLVYSGPVPYITEGINKARFKFTTAMQATALKVENIYGVGGFSCAVEIDVWGGKLYRGYEEGSKFTDVKVPVIADDTHCVASSWRNIDPNGSDGPAKYAFDGRNDKVWHTNYGGDPGGHGATNQPPYALAWSYDEPQMINRITYKGRTNGKHSNDWHEIEVYGRADGTQATLDAVKEANPNTVFTEAKGWYKLTAQSLPKGKTIPNDKIPVDIILDRPAKVNQLAVVVKSVYEGNSSYAMATEVETFKVVAPVVVVEEMPLSASVNAQASSYEKDSGANSSGDGKPQWAFNEDKTQSWHSQYNGALPVCPHWISWDVNGGKGPVLVSAIGYTPKWGGDNGRWAKIDVFGIMNGKEFPILTDYTMDPPYSGNGAAINTMIPFGKPYAVTGLKVVVKESRGASGNANKFANAGVIRTYQYKVVGDPDVADVAGIGMQVRLSGKLGLDSYLELPVAVLNDATAFIRFTRTVAGKETPEVTEIPVVEITGQTYERTGQDQKTHTTYKASCSVAAKEQADQVKIELVQGNQVIKTFVTTSVKDYAQQVLNNTNNDTVKTLIKAMLNYGAKAQQNFKYNTANLATEGIMENGAPVNFDSFNVKPAMTGPDWKPASTHANAENTYPESKGVHYYGSSLLLEDETALRIYVTIEGNPEPGAKNNLDHYSLGIGGKNVHDRAKHPSISAKTVNGNKLYYYDIVVNPQQIDERFDVACHFSGWEDLCTYGVYTYMKSKLDKNDTNDLAKALIALYQYNQAARAYQA